MKYTRKEFAKKCGFRQDNANNYIRRGKIVEENGRIDDKHPTNVAFIERRKLILPRKGEKSKVRQPALPDPEKVAKRNTLLALEQEKKQEEINRMRQQTKMVEFKQSKMLGQYLPVDQVQLFCQTHYRSLVMTFKDVIDNHLTDLAAKCKLSQHDIVSHRKYLTDQFNRAVEKAALASEREIDSMEADQKFTVS